MKELNQHDKSRDEILSILKRSIYHGENNSALVIGPRGSGKTYLINEAIKMLRAELKAQNCSSDIIIVSLSGCLQNDDKSALLEITRQLKLENVINGKVFGSFTDSFEFLLKSFQHGDKQSKPLIFLMDEFDLFTKNKTQLLLYTLLNTIQTASTPICLIGSTCRIDVLDLLEKRIKSRFSHRQIYLFNDYDFDYYVNMAKYFFYTTCVNGATSAKANSNKKKLENFINLMFNDKSVLKFMARQFEYDKSIASLKRLVILPSIKLSFLYENKLLVDEVSNDETCEIFTSVRNEMIESFNLLNLDAKLLLLSGLSILELTLIVVILDLTQTFVEEPFNFDLVYNSYLKFLLKRNSGQQKHERQIVLKAYEHLISLKFILPAADLTSSATSKSSKINKEHTLMYLALDKEEIEQCIQQYPNCPTELLYHSRV